MANEPVKAADAVPQITNPQPPSSDLPPEALDPRYIEEFRAARLMQKKAEAEGKKLLGSAAPMSLQDRLDALEALVLKLDHSVFREEHERKAKADEARKQRFEDFQKREAELLKQEQEEERKAEEEEAKKAKAKEEKEAKEAKEHAKH